MRDIFVLRKIAVGLILSCPILDTFSCSFIFTLLGFYTSVQFSGIPVQYSIYVMILMINTIILHKKIMHMHNNYSSEDYDY